MSRTRTVAGIIQKWREIRDNKKGEWHPALADILLALEILDKRMALLESTSKARGEVSS